MTVLPRIEGLERLRERHVAALNGGDPDAWAACFAADAVQMPPNMPANVGIDGIREWSRGFLASFSAQFSLDPAEALQAGADWVIERGAYEIALTPNGGGGDPLRDHGKYITVYQREGDNWKMARDIWNSDVALPAQSP
ncbi:MAG: nuclear transport factor 2 family protein [Actinobacteria bacterium]|nr:nuclear transport factor 2 family protein [Actinomycetota bacterium]